MSEPEYVPLTGDLTAVFHYEVGELNVHARLLGTTLSYGLP